MTLLFVYGSLKQGFPNSHINTGARIPGAFRTRERFPLYLLGDGHVPCLVLSSGLGHQVLGELYSVGDEGLAAMDRLERLGEPDGYLRLAIEVESVDTEASQALSALVYMKAPSEVVAAAQRAGPLVEYSLEHAKHLWW